MHPFEIPFKVRFEQDEYTIFPSNLEDDPNVLFHGTTLDRAESIFIEKFKPIGILESISFFRTSGCCIQRAYEMREERKHPGVVLAVRFDTLDQKGINNTEKDIVYIYPKVNKIEYDIINYSPMPDAFVWPLPPDLDPANSAITS